ncbi:MAG TPA: 16S rRNA (cytidine(1402)-2'-O)-methyltransferase [Myxococcota bacterium]|nr:16S rRNA (cytidine(1402)-2'-O)-methyltransferase [Myxococcota bacterium]
MGTLRLVATPIGNLEDVTGRALRVLREADLVLAEDTRRTRVLLDRYGIAARPRSLHAHNEAAREREVLEALAAGRDVALVSDAGTPLVSDPGERLVAAALAAGHRVEAVPGPSAVLAALAASGLPAAPFAFLGFLPRRAGERDALLRGWRDRRETLVLFESPRRLGGALRALAAALGDRPAAVARELTKLHEEIARGSLSALAERFAEGARGEVTVVIGGATGGASAGGSPGESVDDRIAALAAQGLRAREIARTLAEETGLPKRALYARAVEAVRRARGDEPAP